jgi:uncharacterized protein
VVIIHGSGPEDRDYLAPWVDFFVQQGVAVLAYDKRGVRDSTGDWKQSSLDDLAGDVLAGIELLKRRGDLDPKRIGLFAVSQGGWIAPMAAARSRDIAFVILHAGSALPVAKNGLAYVEAELRGYGFPAEEIARALAYYQLNDEVTRTGEGWEQLQVAYREAQARGAEWLLEEPQPRDFWFRRFYRRIMDFDPAPAWRQVTCPVLAFFGELDHSVPPHANVGPLEEALKGAGNRDYTLTVLPRANHLFLEAESGVGNEYAGLRRFVRGYFDVMAHWLASRATARRPD